MRSFFWGGGEKLTPTKLVTTQLGIAKKMREKWVFLIGTKLHPNHANRLVTGAPPPAGAQAHRRPGAQAPRRPGAQAPRRPGA